MHDYDKTSKWLIQHHGDSILRLAGVRDVVAWRPLQAELVQPRQLPDGLLEVRCAGQAEPDLYLLELATYPERRLRDQVLGDVALAYLDRLELPEVVVLVLHPKGTLRATGGVALSSRRGWTKWAARWRVVELWTLAAADLLALGDVGVVPWVPLARIDGPPEPVIRQCRDRIDRDAPANEHANLLAVTQILAKLRYNDPRLLTILGGTRAMNESEVVRELLGPFFDKRVAKEVKERVAKEVKERVAKEVKERVAKEVKERVATEVKERVAKEVKERVATEVKERVAKERRDRSQRILLRFLRARFGPVPPETRAAVQAVEDETRLDALIDLAAQCPDLDAFRTRLS
jgi:hypothetical protein